MRRRQDPGAGQGLVSTAQLRRSMRQKWLGRRLGALVTGQRTLVAAEVPLTLALTSEAAKDDPDLGASYAELMDLGLVDERAAVVTMLLVERMRGRESRYTPWIRLLPTRCAPVRAHVPACGRARGTASSRRTLWLRRWAHGSRACELAFSKLTLHNQAAVQRLPHLPKGGRPGLQRLPSCNGYPPRLPPLPATCRIRLRPFLPHPPTALSCCRRRAPQLHHTPVV
jgi:hypothetical protein